jgi:oligopeptide/dipeptide ABC transporter ATP-binding protein
MGVIAETCQDVVVMYAGKVAESAGTIELFKNARHPYTQGLLESIPKLQTPRKTKLNIIEGIVPSLYELPTGCRFRTRCPHVMDICAMESPPLIEVAENHFASCFLY